MSYTYPVWWGGTSTSETPPQIHQRLLDIRKSVGGLKARQQQNGPRFAIKSAKELMDKIRTAIDAAECHCFVAGMEARPMEVESGTSASVRATVCIGAPDGSFITLQGYGQGADRDDKAGGKASTYAYKDALIKGLTLPDAEMVDTDDEEGVRPTRKTKAAAAPAKTPAELEQYIAQAATVASLDLLLPALRAAPSDARVALSEAYKARRKELGA